jgi:peptide-methionine (S)-S-oxide reductase
VKIILAAAVLCFLGLFMADAQAEKKTDKTVLAGGCFWCMEKDFEELPGVSDVVSGFTGGTARNPTYNGDHRGHYEAVEITYDAEVVSYTEILAHFWVNIDPFDARGQFCDKGPSYLSAIFVASDLERTIAEATRKQVVERFPDQSVVTPILDAARFYPIKGREIGHQDYYKKNPLRYKAYRWNCGRDKRLEQVWGPTD